MRQLTPNEATASSLLTAAWEAIANGPDAATYRPLLDDISAFQRSLHTDPACTERTAHTCPVHGTCTADPDDWLPDEPCSQPECPLHGPDAAHARPRASR